jgi:hypothetical protein
MGAQVGAECRLKLVSPPNNLSAFFRLPENAKFPRRLFFRD